MDARKIVAIVLIVGGTLGLAYGSFSYTKESHQADIGGLHLELNERQRLEIPRWAGIGAILLGAVLLVIPRK